MANLIICTVFFITFIALTFSKIIPQAQICYSYANANTNYATCGKLICPYGCSWPFVTANGCVPLGSNSTGQTSEQICHLGFWKENSQVFSCNTKFGSYKCKGMSLGFAACTGCHA